MVRLGIKTLFVAAKSAYGPLWPETCFGIKDVFVDKNYSSLTNYGGEIESKQDILDENGIFDTHNLA